MSSKNNYYGYSVPGRGEGVVEGWIACERLVSGVSGARYRGFKTRSEALEWLRKGASYASRVHKKMPKGVYFDAGTGRGEGVEISVTDEKGTNLLHRTMHTRHINAFGKHRIPHDATNNYGELLAAKHAFAIAIKAGAKRVAGDSALVVNFWSKGIVRKDKVGAKTVTLSKATARLRKKFEAIGGRVVRISGDDNPADLGFHRR